MAAHSRPSKIVSRTKQSFTPVQNSDPVGSFVSEPFTLPKSLFNPRIRPFDEFYFTAPSIKRYHPLCDELFLCLADSFDNSLNVSAREADFEAVTTLAGAQ